LVRHRTVRILAVLLLGACASAGSSGDGLDGGKPDAASPGGDANPDSSSGGDSTGSSAALIITEVVLAPSTGEFIEIANPTAQTVDLSTYYVSDSGLYFKLPAGAPVLDVNDFIVKFPAGATIPPSGVITVAIDTAANFATVYGVQPTFSVAGGTMTPVATNGVGTLTNAGEIAVLFEWDGQMDLVRDVDIMLAGVPTAANGIIDKSGQAFDGPDADTTPTAYATDARTMHVQATAPASGKSTKRIALDTGHEVAGTNGIDGHDETSEDTASTWDTAFTVPTPGTVPAGLLP
jgi:hypothetical protein